MKRTLKISSVVLAVMLIFACVANADWVPYYEGTQNVQATRVEVTTNEWGQDVYKVINSYGNVILDIRARGGNIWNETSQILYTSTNRSSKDVSIDSSLNVYGISTVNKFTKYRNGFQTGEVPVTLETLVAVGFEENSNHFAIGFLTISGPCDLNGNRKGYNYSNYDYSYGYTDYGYPRLTQNDGIWTYQTNSETYRYKITGNTLYLVDDNQKTKSYLANINEIAFSENEYLYGVDSRTSEVIQIPVKSYLTKEDTYDETFGSWIYKSSTSNFVVGYRTVDGDKIYFDDDDWDDDDDDYWDDDDDDEYPRLAQKGDKLIIKTSSSTSYTYYWDGDELSYEDEIIETDVEEVEISDKYLLFVMFDYDEESYICKKVRFGRTSATEVCDDFQKFIYDDSTGLVEKVKDDNGKSYNV